MLKQEAVNCVILDVYDAKKLLKSIGYKEIMNIKEDVVYEKEGFQLAIKKRLEYYYALDKTHTIGDYTDFIKLINKLEIEMIKTYLKLL